MAKIIDGKKIAEDIKNKLETEIETLAKKGITPCLGVLLIGDNPASNVYVGMKEKACAKLSMISKTIRLDKDVTQEEVLRHIDELNNDKAVNGILVQLPLPNQLDENEILMRIDPMKDVDGIHPMSFGRLLAGDPTFISCTPHGILKILEYEGVDTEGKHAVVVGRSIIVGKPIAVLLSRKAKGGNATVTVCHTRTKNLSEFTRQADILIAAMGVPEAITGDMIKEGAVVIDVGT
ncbi:bifunctional 5,10-methylene-tetrahydrofolate dehydrogenase/5,10-methylene-tetrahydrofolate cyclohydrolase, partial [bacterium]|nr:bifunctional 5,10-methylene-tetrahydrofolate dehydrogenase/5,10-methylene-tetrahydrofolate cyclohydrolase [bacterium]